MITAEWFLNLMVSLGAGAIGFVFGQIVQWRRHPGAFISVTPTIRPTERTKRLGAMALALLAITTVGASTVTTIQVRQEVERRVEYETGQRECNRLIAERLSVRAQIAEADHQNTTDFIVEIRESMRGGPAPGVYPMIVSAADKYMERQDRLAEAKISAPIDKVGCR